MVNIHRDQQKDIITPPLKLRYLARIEQIAGSIGGPNQEAIMKPPYA
jgi:hypothetical protein